MPLEQIKGTTVLYYVHDQLGSTRLLTNSSGTVVATYTYDPYGALAGSTGSVTNPFGFAGAYNDPDSGLIYLVNRWYTPATGQFLTVDPDVAETDQPYAYTDGDPVNGTDPLGLIVVGDVLGEACKQSSCKKVVARVLQVEAKTTDSHASSSETTHAVKSAGTNTKPSGVLQVRYPTVSSSDVTTRTGISIGSSTSACQGKQLFGGLLALGGAGSAGAGIEGLVGEIEGAVGIASAVGLVAIGLGLVVSGIYEALSC